MSRLERGSDKSSRRLELAARKEAKKVIRHFGLPIKELECAGDCVLPVLVRFAQRERARAIKAVIQIVDNEPDLRMDELVSLKRQIRSLQTEGKRQVPARGKP